MNSQSLKGGLLVALCACSTTALSKTTSIAYWYPAFGSTYAFVVDWHSNGTARVASNYGAESGKFTDNGTQRLVKLKTPFTYLIDALDCTGAPYQQQYVTSKLVFRPQAGSTAAVVEIGVETDIGGCTPGQETPYGSPTDPGTTMNDLNMKNRPGEGDIVPGAQLAGLTDGPLLNYATLGNGVTTAEFGQGTVTFAASGVTDPYDGVDGWLVIDLPDSTQRAYTRLNADAATGIQTWLASNWADGQPGMVTYTLVAMPNVEAGFGSLKQQAHSWQSGLFIDIFAYDLYDLYQDHTGDWDFDSGSGPIDIPITWNMHGSSLVVHRTTPVQRDRTWAPIANYGKNHFVFEWETQTVDGVQTYNFPARVNFMVDEGPATPPRFAQGMH